MPISHVFRKMGYPRPTATNAKKALLLLLVDRGYDVYRLRELVRQQGAVGTCAQFDRTAFQQDQAVSARRAPDMTNSLPTIWPSNSHNPMVTC